MSSDRVLVEAPTLFRPQALMHFSPGMLSAVVTSIPLSSFILHEDSKQHTSMEFERQNIEIAGHFRELEGVVDSGFADVSHSLGNISSGITKLDRTTAAGFRNVTGAIGTLDKNMARGFETVRVLS